MAAHPITALLHAWNGGDQDALAIVTPLVHAELRQMARRHMNGERAGHSLPVTGLVNECYLRLVDAQPVRWQDRDHFPGLVVPPDAADPGRLRAGTATRPLVRSPRNRAFA